jgi:hypothetical protein
LQSEAAPSDRSKHFSGQSEKENLKFKILPARQHSQ